MKALIFLKRITILFFATVILIIFPSVSFAHSGGTDEDGGHYDSSTGEYHYHHGHPAHQHINGVCPYNFDDRTSSSTNRSRSSGSYITEEQHNEQIDALKEEYNDKIKILENRLKDNNRLILYTVLFFSAATIILISMALYARKKIKDQKRLYADQRYQNERQVSELSNQCAETLEAKQFIENETSKLLNIGKESDILDSIIEKQKQLSNENKSKVFEIDRLNLCKIPEDSEVGEDGLPRQMGACDFIIENGVTYNYWGDKYTFYITKHGKKFHKEGCPSGHIPINASLVEPSGYVPCSVCSPVLPPLEWYRRYIIIQRLKSKYIK